MFINTEAYLTIKEETAIHGATLVAVSKTKPVEAIQGLYNLGQRDFGENYVQELAEKQPQLPADIRWHFIGHLQSNKVKYIAPFVHLVQGIDSYRLLREVDKQAKKLDRITEVLLQVHIAQEETKFGFDDEELRHLLSDNDSGLPDLKSIKIVGFMGMASFTEDEKTVHKEFTHLKKLYDRYSQLQCANCKLQTLSMGMSGDYKIALNEGSTMVRIGSLLFGKRE